METSPSPQTPRPRSAGGARVLAIWSSFGTPKLNKVAYLAKLVYVVCVYTYTVYIYIHTVYIYIHHIYIYTIYYIYTHHILYIHILNYIHTYMYIYTYYDILIHIIPSFISSFTLFCPPLLGHRRRSPPWSHRVSHTRSARSPEVTKSTVHR